jgi:hypothetical protein
MTNINGRWKNWKARETNHSNCLTLNNNVIIQKQYKEGGSFNN